MIMLTHNPRQAGCNRSKILASISESPEAQFAMSPLWRNRPVRRGMAHLMELLAVLTALAILLAFYHVVQGSVLHGERLRLALAAQSAATQHCKSLAGAGAADTCLRQLKAPAHAAPTPTVILVSVKALSK